MTIGDVVLFTDRANYAAGQFCHRHGVAGTVVGIQPGCFLVDADLGYVIYAQPSDIVLAPDAVPGLDKCDKPILVKVPADDGGL